MPITPQKTTGSGEAAIDGEYLSSQLSELLSRQLALARRGKLDEVMTLAGSVDQLLSQANRKQLEKIWTEGSIRGLYDEIRLILGAAKGEVATELAGIRKGRNSLRAYKGISR